jgi:hypothetical protein
MELLKRRKGEARRALQEGMPAFFQVDQKEEEM